MRGAFLIKSPFDEDDVADDDRTSEYSQAGNIHAQI
jgi:hypothetical protein